VQSGNTYLAYFGTTNYTPAQWTSFRSSGIGGANSLNINPNWFTPFNLRHRNSSLNAGNNQLSLVPVDMDGAARTTPVTIGADEYKSTGIDAGITQIVSVPPCVGVNNVVVQFTNHGTTTLTSATINWSINSVSQLAYSWTGSLAAGSSVNITVGTYNFIFGSYVFDASSSNPNNNIDADPSNDAASISSSTALGGTYTIGASGNYTSFTAAIAAVTGAGVCAPVVFRVQPGTYTESITIGPIPGVSSVNTVTFESFNNDSASATLTSAASITVYLNGADYIRFRKMTIGSTGGKCFEFANGATNNIVENCLVLGYNIASTSTLYYALGSTSSTNNDEFNTIRNNYIRYGSYGVYWYGNATAPYESGLVFENNQIFDSYIYGAYFLYLNAPQIIRNTFDITGSSYTSTSYALRTSFIYNAADISRNLIFGRTYSYYANSIIGTISVRPKISNNFIVSVQNQNNTCYGLYSASNQYADFYHNSVNTNHLNALTGYTTYTLYETSSTNTNYFNNIFCDSTVANPYSYAAYLVPSTSTVFDYNNYFVQPGTSNLAYHNSYGTFSSGMFTTFRNVSYGGANSLNLRPSFYSMSNLRHRNSGLNAGTNLISVVPADFDGQTRSTTVTMGADEFKPVANDAGIAQIITSLPCQGVNNIVVRLSNYGTSTLNSASINWTVNNVAQTAYTWSGSLASGASVNVTIGTFNLCPRSE
jgi:hypothetical protein